ncbi:MAG: hypothetical protein PHV74_13045 [Dehalococcoidia bacterium]|nr:hypothetical protein [Dehalococcoidia bacterium]
MTQSEFRYRLFAGTPFIVLEDEIWVTPEDTYLESEAGETIAVSSLVHARALLKQGDDVWYVSIDLIEEGLSWQPYSSSMDIPIRSNPIEADEQARQDTLDILPTLDQIAEWISQGAKSYVFIHHGVEYSLSEDGGIVGNRVTSSYVSVYLILDDDMLVAGINIESGQLADHFEFPQELHLSTSEKETVMAVIESQPEVIELLNRGAEIVFLGRSNDEDDAVNVGFAMMYIEETNEFWGAQVNLDTRSFMRLTQDSD